MATLGRYRAMQQLQMGSMIRHTQIRNRNRILSGRYGRSTQQFGMNGSTLQEMIANTNKAFNTPATQASNNWRDGLNARGVFNNSIRNGQSGDVFDNRSASDDKKAGGGLRWWVPNNSLGYRV